MEFEDGEYWRLLRHHIREQFRFLETEYGFGANEGGMGVSYRKGVLSVSVYQGRPADAIEVDFCGLAWSGISLYTIGQWCGKPAPGTQAYEPTFGKVLANMAAFVRANCGPLILGDKRAFAQLRAINEQNQARANEELNAFHGRRDVEAAWASRDYVRVAQLLSRANWTLKASEKKKLSIAKRKAQEPRG